MWCYASPPSYHATQVTVKDVTNLLLLLKLSGALLAGLLLALALFQKSLWDQDLVLSGHGTVGQISLQSTCKFAEAAE